MAAAASSRNRQEEEKSSNGMRERDEGMSTGNVLPHLKSYKRFLRHGTTCVSSISKVGLIFVGDGLARNNDPDKPEDNHITSEISQKVLFVGNRMLISMAGDGFWIEFILVHLVPLIENPVLVDVWTCESCARFVRDTQRKGPEPVLKMFGLKTGALDGAFCSMMFGAYEQNQAKLVYANDDVCEEIIDANEYDSDEDPDGEQDVCLKSIGSGSKIIDQAALRNNAIEILSGDHHFEEQLIMLLSSMKETCDRQRHTGGVIQAYYMPPPPGVAHMVYDAFHEWIPLDLLMIQANMYCRLHEAAVEAGSFVADDYKEQFLQSSNDYEQMLLQLSAGSERIIEKQDELLREQDQRLMNLLSRGKWFNPRRLS